MHLYKRLLGFVKPYWVRLMLAMICMAFFSLATAATAFLVKPVLDDIFMEKQASMLMIVPLLVMGLYLIKGLFDFGQSYLMAYVGQKTVADLREALYHHIQYLSFSFFTGNTTGTLMSRITNDVNLIQRSVSDAITSLFKDVFTIAGLTGVIFYRDVKLALIAFLIFPWAAVPIVKFGKKLRKFSGKSQEKMADISTFLQETISGSRIIKAFGMEEYENRRFSQENRRYFRIIMKRLKIRALSSPVMELLGGLGAAVIIWYGGYQVIKGHSTPGTFFSFMAALMMLYEPVKRLNKANQLIQEGLAAAARVFSILDTVSEIKDKKGAKFLPTISRSIEFQNVSFKYENDWALQDINLKVKAGEAIALVGTSGGGKTTMANLLPRFYDVSKGRILIDGIDIRDATINSLRSQIGLVTQQTVLFNDTVRYNIAYGDMKKSDQEIIGTARSANAHHFITKLPNGYDTIIGEQGVKLSGGEKQRLAIARALLKNAPILILDEATSSLDNESEKEVQKALEILMKNRTTFIIAHRLSTVVHADLIVVISHGRIVEQGKHDKLIKLKGEYYRLYHTQFQAKEFPGGKEDCLPEPPLVH